MIPLARYRLDCVATTPLHLPEYAGSTLRGAFGGAFRRAVCVTRQPDCKACALYRSCAYTAVFEPPPVVHAIQKFSQIPAPYIVEPPDWGEQHHAPGDAFHFHFVLIGHALRHLPLLIHAWQRALEHGIGPGDGRARLAGVSHCTSHGDVPVYDADSGELRAHPVEAPPAQPAPHAVMLRLHTPLRLQHEGRPLRPAKLTAERLLVSVAKRAALLQSFHGDAAHPVPDFNAIKHSAAQLESRPDLQWRDWTRCSSRQQQTMQLGGVVGAWTLRGDLGPVWPALHLGQWIHVGKNATFGLGRCTLHPA